MLKYNLNNMFNFKAINKYIHDWIKKNDMLNKNMNNEHLKIFLMEIKNKNDIYAIKNNKKISLMNYVLLKNTCELFINEKLNNDKMLLLIIILFGLDNKNAININYYCQFFINDLNINVINVTMNEIFFELISKKYVNLFVVDFIKLCVDDKKQFIYDESYMKYIISSNNLLSNIDNNSIKKLDDVLLCKKSDNENLNKSEPILHNNYFKGVFFKNYFVSLINIQNIISFF